MVFKIVEIINNYPVMNVFSILKALKAPSSIRRNDIGQLCQGTMNFIELNQLALNEGMLKKKYITTDGVNHTAVLLNQDSQFMILVLHSFVCPIFYRLPVNVS